MKIAAATYIFNEDINLRIWLNHYGESCGRENIYIVDAGSTRQPDVDLRGVNIIHLPYAPFDDIDKSAVLSSLHALLLRSYDAVIITDCDEILVADPDKYKDLKDYARRGLSDYRTAIGLNVVHALDREYPIDFSQAMLEQRKYAIFTSYECKTLISRIPTRWSEGLHYVDREPAFDPDLYNFHIKLFDYNTAMNRHMKNRNNVWKDKKKMKNSHHYSETEKFFNYTFHPVLDMLGRGVLDRFDFAEKLSSLTSEIIRDENGFFCFRREAYQFVMIPERFSRCIRFGSPAAPSLA
ncbi:hypothetical protein [Komagataeibacter sp. FNDCF1]|uniref:hypothetical protein n=1 Tax=Komagataeibacter sp. FNDCF1 TaxID=2878681 RepID=UPI001E2943BD|nr:hypothetical protein [Komagataeibacter sp. FNDCF1]MCE2564526.1 hypothetical protein [Komagataeibacter sp. FNDCF1]